MVDRIGSIYAIRIKEKMFWDTNGGNFSKYKGDLRLCEDNNNNNNVCGGFPSMWEGEVWIGRNSKNSRM